MTDVKIAITSAPRESLLMASADQVSVIGNGTTDDPFRAIGTGFLAEFDNSLSSSSEPLVGNPVVATDDVPSVGVATVRTGSAGLGSPQLPNIVGILVVAGEAGSTGGQVSVRSSGPTELTTAEWDLITLDEGGLTPGAAYYLDWGFNSFGRLTKVAPSTSGMATVLVGVAVNSTTMLLGLPAVPIEIA